MVANLTGLIGERESALGQGLAGLKVAVVAGTQSGNALMVAELVAKRLCGVAGARVELLPEGCEIDRALSEADVLVACVASHGEGDLPDEFLVAYCGLEARAPDLSHLRYGLIGLGDRTYSTFCGGAWKFDRLLQRLCARRAGEVCEIDASSQPFPDEEALLWLSGWLEEV